MARAVTTKQKLIWSVLAWTFGLLMFFPIMWTFLTSFKTEGTAISDPPVWFFFDWTLENYAVVQERSNYPKALMNSIIIAVGSTLLGIVIAVLINLPIIVWMLYTYFKEIPGEILEASRMDGADLRSEILYVLTPMALPGIASTILLNIILAWNEAFWTILLTTVDAAPLTAFIASFSAPEGLFYAKLSAASMMAIAPILVMGWFSQKQLVRGLTFGAVK